MKTIYKILILVVLALLLQVATTYAAPTGTTVTAVGNNNATFTANDGGTGTDWFEYGMTPSTLVVWTPNLTAAGSYTWTEYGSPLTCGETYYVAGCDVNGCDSPVSFTILAATPLPATTYGLLFTNATQSHFNVIYFVLNIMGPYAWLFPASASQLAISIVMGIVLFAVFFGIAMRTRYVAVPIVVGLIVAPYLLYQSQGLGLGIPPEFIGITEGITYACVAGILYLILKKT